MRLAFQTEIPLPRHVVFRFHQNSANLLLLHAGWSSVRLLKHAGCVNDGAQTWVEFTMGGFLPMVLGFQHMNFQPGYRFTDQIIHGPFKTFLHVHEFEERGESTLVRDLLDVSLPWWLGGALATKLFVGPIVREAFRQRAAALRRLAADGTLIRVAQIPLQPGDT